MEHHRRRRRTIGATLPLPDIVTLVTQRPGCTAAELLAETTARNASRTERTALYQNLLRQLSCAFEAGELRSGPTRECTVRRLTCSTWLPPVEPQGPQAWAARSTPLHSLDDMLTEAISELAVFEQVGA